MRNLILGFCFAIIANSCLGQETRLTMPFADITRTVDLLSDLRQLPITSGNIFLTGKTTLTDGLGGFYRWDSSSSASEDTTFMNVIISNVTSSGRWVRTFQKAKSYPQGVLVINGGVKTFYVSGTTDSNGEVTINLTDDNTSTGNALFTEIWFTDSRSTTSASSLANSIQSYTKSIAVNLKTASFGFFKANALTITLGLVYSPLTSAGSGITTQFKVEGI